MPNTPPDIEELRKSLFDRIRDSSGQNLISPQASADNAEPDAAILDAVSAQQPPAPSPAIPEQPSLSSSDAAPLQKTADEVPAASTTSMKVRNPAITGASSESKKRFSRGITVDTSQIVDATSLAIHAASKRVQGGLTTSSFQVVALQSNFAALMTPLCFADTARLNSTVSDSFTAELRNMRVVYDHIAQASYQSLSFEDWLSHTAEGDYDTLIYGMYAATYPGENKFTVRCGHCERPNEILMPVEQLVQVADPEAFTQVRRLLDPRTPSSIQDSMVLKSEYIDFGDFIVEARLPSLQDRLNERQWYDNAIDRNTGTILPERRGAETMKSLAKFIRSVLLPENGKMLKLSGEERIIPFLGGLVSRAQDVIDAIEEYARTYTVEYSLPKFNCVHCSKENGQVALDMEKLLFLKIRARA